MDNITIVDSSNNEVIAVISKDEVIIKDGYEVIENVGVEEEGGINMTEILLEDGKTYELNTAIELIVEAIHKLEENNNEFLFIAPKGIKRLIRIRDIKEITEVKEIEKFSTNNISISVNIDSEVIVESIIERLNNAKQGVRYSSQGK